MKLSGLTKMVKRQLVCNVFHNDESDDFYIGTASAIYCATGFPRPLNRNQMGAMLGISEDTMIEKVVYNDFDCAYGTVEYRIGLLTLRQYGKYWRLIPKVDTPWWLATPYGTPNCSPRTSNNNYVWYVLTDGSGNYFWAGNSYGVRPALYFPSTLWVSTEDEGEAGFCLADVPLDDLLAEIKSRAEE